ncbi:MAG: FAD-dependent oxidoreductase [Nitrobacter vulgaris]|nr:FAD-dependent oxidoreductase [Nitrobacter vulgaris]
MARIPENRTYWNETATATAFPQLSEVLNVDVAIIGGGIVGITTARMLKNMGQTVAVIEARSVGRQVTGKSTAKITSQHSIIYQTLEQKFGEDRARLYANAQESAVRKIRSLAAPYGIDCDIETKSAYAYTRDESYVSKIEKEVEVAQRLGLPASLVHQTGLPFDVRAAIRFENQAQFHPIKYVVGLAKTIPGEGCHVFESSRAVDWDPTRVVTDQGSVTARHVVMATHLPLEQVGGYYALAIRRLSRSSQPELDVCPTACTSMSSSRAIRFEPTRARTATFTPSSQARASSPVIPMRSANIFRKSKVG